MDTEPIVATTIARVVLDGTAFTLPAPGTSGRTARPGISKNACELALAGTADPTTDESWASPGEVDTMKIEQSSEEKKIFKCVPHKVLFKKKRTKRELDFTLSIIEASPLMLSILMGSKTVLDKTGTDYSILEGRNYTGWLHCENFTDEDVLFNTSDTYCDFTIKNVDFNDDVVKFDLVGSTLYSPLNKGTLKATV